MNTLIILSAILGLVYAQRPESAAAILRQDSDINPDGSYQWRYETDNGISADESGRLNNAREPAIEAQGGFAYRAPDGTPISIQYIADENGFQPQGAHLPVAPPIPEYILRSLEWSRAHPQEERK